MSRIPQMKPNRSKNKQIQVHDIHIPHDKSSSFDFGSLNLTWSQVTNHNILPYVLAATSKSKSVVELLIKKGADVNMTNKEGATVLHKATEINNLDVINILLRHGAKVRIQNPRSS